MLHASVIDARFTRAGVLLSSTVGVGTAAAKAARARLKIENFILAEVNVEKEYNKSQARNQS